MLIRIAIIWLICVLAACSQQTTQAPTPKIVVDQFGYLPELEKRAVIRSPEIGYDSGESFAPSGRYAIIDVASGEAVYEGAPTAWNDGVASTQCPAIGSGGLILAALTARGEL